MRYVAILEKEKEEHVQARIAEMIVEHAGYYGLPHGWQHGFGFKAESDLMSTDIRSCEKEYMAGDGVLLSALTTHIGGWLDSPEKGAWITSGGNVLILYRIVDQWVIIADGRRHGIPWGNFPAEALENANVLNYVTQCPDTGVMEFGLTPE